MQDQKPEISGKPKLGPVLIEELQNFEKKIAEKNSLPKNQRSEIEDYQGIFFQEDKNYIEKIMDITLNS
jgi:hypothetical protein